MVYKTLYVKDKRLYEYLHVHKFISLDMTNFVSFQGESSKSSSNEASSLYRAVIVDMMSIM